ncbi:MAG: hypothetical protein IJB26_06240 [Clostridia bacterium]|nr:hypothetical protein [Clostridia bacterium]
MQAVFLQILNMSLTASWLVLAVVILRVLLKRAPKAIRCVLWAFVGLRLACPFSIESALSLIPSAKPIPDTITTDATPTINSGVPAVNAVVNPVLSQSFTPNPGDSVNPMQILAFVAAVAWLVGIAVLLVYAAVSFWRVRRQVGASLHLRDNVYLCDGLPSPFILGILRPRIYLPTGLDDEATAHILAHEQAHLRRRDHWWKPLGYLLLTVHWFNPIVWVAYILLCRDIELACDERVARTLDEDGKAAYSSTLLACGAHRRMVTACPLAFGEVGIKARVKSVLSYKKPTLWILLAAVLAAVAVAIGFLTNPTNKMPPDGTYRAEQSVCIVDHGSVSSYGMLNDLDWRVKGGSLWALYDGSLSETNLGELESFTLTEENFDNFFKQELRPDSHFVDWRVDTDAATLRMQTKRAWRCKQTEHNEYYYILQARDGSYYACYGVSADVVSDIARNYAYITRLNLTTADGVLPKTGLYEPGEVLCRFEGETYGFNQNASSLFIDNGTLFLLGDAGNLEIGKFEPFTPNKENFDAFFKSRGNVVGNMVWNADSSAAELRQNTHAAWRIVTTNGHPCYYYLLEMNNGELIFCDGMSDTVMHNFFIVNKIAPIKGFCATVLEVQQNHLLVAPFEGEEIRRCSDRIEVPTSLLSYEVPELYSGDQVWIGYDGDVQDTYPARLASLPISIVHIKGHRDLSTVGTYAVEITESRNDRLETVYTRKEGVEEDYNLHYFTINDATIVIGNKPVSLKTALANGSITTAQLLLQANKDANADICHEDAYDDGGSILYSYDGYRLLLRYSNTEWGDATTGLYDLYLMSHYGSLDTLERVLYGETEDTGSTTTTAATTVSTTTTKRVPDTCKVNPTVIVAIEGDRVIVDAKDHYIHVNDSRYNGYDRYAFAVDNIGDFQVGDKVKVVHDGSFTDGEPPRGRLLSISRIE